MVGVLGEIPTPKFYPDLPTSGQNTRHSAVSIVADVGPHAPVWCSDTAFSRSPGTFIASGYFDTSTYATCPLASRFRSSYHCAARPRLRTLESKDTSNLLIQCGFDSEVRITRPRPNSPLEHLRFAAALPPEWEGAA
jgi:hypothetical protein